MQLDDRGHETQTEAYARPGSAAFQPDEALQNSLPILLWNSWAVIRDCQNDAAVMSAAVMSAAVMSIDRYGDLAARGRKFDGVIQHVVFLTELTSNIGTTATFMPVVGAIAIEAGHDPIVLLVPVTLAASCAFMLPVATPPNAIVFGSGMLTIPKMVRAGLALNLIAIILVSVVALTLTPKLL